MLLPVRHLASTLRLRNPEAVGGYFRAHFHLKLLDQRAVRTGIILQLERLETFGDVDHGRLVRCRYPVVTTDVHEKVPEFVVDLAPAVVQA